MNRVRVSVVKIGGSLLASPTLPRRLGNWLQAEAHAQPETHFVLLTGGGKWVDAIREIDAQTPLGEERAHWICVDLMEVTAGLVNAMLPELSIVGTLRDLEHRLTRPGSTLLRPRQFLAELEAVCAGTKLPQDWSVTSDAIAGRLAIVLAADELVLLKSVPPPAPFDGEDRLANLAAQGYVDAFFPMLSDDLPPWRLATLGGS